MTEPIHITTNSKHHMNQSIPLASDLPKEQALVQLIHQSVWWRRACTCVDPHYSNTSGVMLVDHLNAVCANVEALFTVRFSPFLSSLFDFAESLELSKAHLQQTLRLVALLHDIGKTEDDKSVLIPHPLHGHLVHKRHSVVGVYAAKDIYHYSDILAPDEKHLLYSVIEEHDVSYGLFKESRRLGTLPTFVRWQALNQKISPVDGTGLLYLLLFKLADTHGHCDLEDVNWFFEQTAQAYFKPLGLHLPIPRTTDVQ